MQGLADGSMRKEDRHRLIYKDLGIQPGTGPFLPGVREPLIEPFLIITYLALPSARDGAVPLLCLFPEWEHILNVLVRLNSTSCLFKRKQAG